MKVANLIRAGIAARTKWLGMGNSTRVVLIAKDQRDLTLIVWPDSNKEIYARYCLDSDTRPQYPPLVMQYPGPFQMQTEEERVRLDQWRVNKEDIWMGYGEKTDTLVVADPE
jgi:hypothetical protein